MRRLPPQSALYDVTGQPPSEVRYVEPPGALADDDGVEGWEPLEEN